MRKLSAFLLTGCMACTGEVGGHGGSGSGNRTTGSGAAAGASSSGRGGAGNSVSGVGGGAGTNSPAGTAGTGASARRHDGIERIERRAAARDRAEREARPATPRDAAARAAAPPGRGGTGGSAAGRGGSGGSTGGSAAGRGGGGAAGSGGTGAGGGAAGRGGTGGGGAAGRGGATGSGGSAAGGAGTTGTGGGAVVGQLFDFQHPWTTDVSAYSKAAMSDTIINGLVAAGGWGQGNVFLTEPSILILEDNGSAPLRTFTRTEDFFSPDCDNVPFPVPTNGAIEGEDGYACAGDGDCHLIVVQRAQKKLYEMWRANITGSTFQGGCAAFWDLAKQYGPSLRGRSCTSADAAGFPIAAMLATSDEVASGRVGHALRFILPNARIRDGIYVPPATHSTEATSGGPATPPYGVRFRLKASYDTSALSSGAKVLAQALKTYGMFLSDGGNIALTIASDRSRPRSGTSSASRTTGRCPRSRCPTSRSSITAPRSTTTPWTSAPGSLRR